MAAALAIGLLVLVWMKTGLKWMCVPGALFVVNWLGSSESFSFLNVLQGMWGFLLAGAIVLPFLALREGTFSWIDLVLAATRCLRHCRVHSSSPMWDVTSLAICFWSARHLGVGLASYVLALPL